MQVVDFIQLIWHIASRHFRNFLLGTTNCWFIPVQSNMAFLFDHPLWSNLDCVGSWAAGNVFHHWWGWHIRGTLLQEENIKRVASIFWIEKYQVGLVVPCSVQSFLQINYRPFLDYRSHIRSIHTKMKYSLVNGNRFNCCYL